MSIEEQVFAKKHVIFNQLIPYGFRFDGKDYYYEEKFFDGAFEARISISQSGQVSGCVLDSDLDEEYVALRVERAIGTFVGQVREAYVQILEKIADACFEALPFLKDQTNRLASYLTTTFGDEMDNPFAKFPNFTAFRHPYNQKWYGLVGVMERSKLALGEEVWTEEERKETVEIINIKVNPKAIPALLKKDAIYPAYHMSKKSWVTIVLDGRLPDQELFKLVIESRSLVAPKTVSNPNEPNYWIIPANMRHYDIDKEFAASAEVFWPQKKSIKKDDVILIYITAPTKAVRYLCQVIAANLLDGDDKWMKVRMIKRLSPTELGLELLRELGVTNIRGARRLTAPAIAHIKKTYNL